MRRFIRKRWLGIPAVLLVAVLVLVLAAGSAFASFTFWTGTATVTVDECMTVVNLGGDDGEFASDWAVSMNPGESKIVRIQVRNSSSADIVVNLSATENYASIDAAWTPASATVTGGSYANFTLTVTATTDATPSSYTVNLGITRG